MITTKDIYKIKNELKKEFVTEKVFYRAIDELMSYLADFRNDFEGFRTEMRSFRTEVNDILNNNERRLDKLEDKVLN